MPSIPQRAITQVYKWFIKISQVETENNLGIFVTAEASSFKTEQRKIWGYALRLGIHLYVLRVVKYIYQISLTFTTIRNKPC